MGKNVEYKESGLKCDNPICDYRDETAIGGNVEDYINKPCPKCGENLLTQEDHDRHQMVLDSFEFINSLTEDEINEFLSLIPKDQLDGTMESLGVDSLDEPIKVRISTHNEIKIEKNDKID